MPSTVGGRQAGGWVRADPTGQHFLWEKTPLRGLPVSLLNWGQGVQEEGGRSHAAPILIRKNAHLRGLGVVTG